MMEIKRVNGAYVNPFYFLTTYLDVDKMFLKFD